MCNLSEGVWERGMKKGVENVVLKMYQNDFTIAQIALATGKDEGEVREIIEREMALV